MNQDYYSRQQVIEIFGFDERFLDELEEEELVFSKELDCSPERVFTLDQVDRIRIINNLVSELNVNLPGVEVILEMRENMIRMQRQFDQILEAIVKELKVRLGRTP
ncbi:MAG: chaperone modulator CbpM [Desulfomonilaceae bacterium]